jgi:hypothetical protein
LPGELGMNTGGRRGERSDWPLSSPVERSSLLRPGDGSVARLRMRQVSASVPAFLAVIAPGAAPWRAQAR